MEYREEEETVFNLSGNWFGQPLMTSTKEKLRVRCCHRYSADKEAPQIKNRRLIPWVGVTQLPIVWASFNLLSVVGQLI